MADMTDEEIVRTVQRGDADAFRLLMERYKERLMRYARRFLFSSDDAQDLVQESFIKAYINIRSFDVSRKFSSWMYRIAHNEFINALKKKGREKISFMDLDVLFPHPVSRETADKDIHREDLQKMLDAGLQKLSSKYREPLVLYYIEEMDYKEIADILQIPMATVGVRLRRGKLQMQKLLTNPHELNRKK